MGASGSKSSEAAGSNAGPSGKSAAKASACPVPEEVRTKAVYNVYNQRMDPSACPKLVCSQQLQQSAWLRTEESNMVMCACG